MTTEELAELFLAHLYELAEEAPHPNFLFSVNDFTPKLGITDREELQKALNYLGDKGFIILASFDRFGGISAGITIEGSSFVERGGETGIMGQYRKNSQIFEKNPSEPYPAAIDREKPVAVKEEKQALFFTRRAAEAILVDIENVIEKDDTVSVEAKKDLFSDLATVRIQMERNVKDRQIINIVLNHLSNIPSIAPLVTGLNCIIDTYFR